MPILPATAAGLLAAVALVTASPPASAAPTTSPLADASLFCGTPLTAAGTFAYNVNGADPFWITSGPLAGKWNIVAYAHYAETGVLATTPVTQEVLDQNPGTYSFVDHKTFGSKTGQTDTASCEIVARWKAGTAAPTDLTVFAPLTLSRTG
jgi:hypothetical protein